MSTLRTRSWLWILVPLAIFAASRVADDVLIQHLVSLQDPTMLASTGPVPLSENPPSYGHVTANWDGQWYHWIANHGYPSTLPKIGGTVQQNPWAFYPLYPFLVRAFMTLGLSFATAAGFVSIAAGAGAACLLYWIIRQRGTHFTATMAVLGLSFAPTAPILQFAYTESIALALALLALALLGRRRYGWFALVTLALALARPMALPLALVAGIHWLIRWHQRSKDPFPAREQLRAGGSAIFAALSFGVWPAIAAATTGQLNAYFATQRAWVFDNRSGWPTWLVQTLQLQSPSVVAMTLGAMVILIAIAVQPGAAVWGRDLRIWAVVYPLYIFASTRPTPSIHRYLLLAAVPWWPMPALSERVRNEWARAALMLAVVLVGLALQFVWLKWYVILWPGHTAFP